MREIYGVLGIVNKNRSQINPQLHRKCSLCIYASGGREAAEEVKDLFQEKRGDSNFGGWGMGIMMNGDGWLPISDSHWPNLTGSITDFS